MSVFCGVLGTLLFDVFRAFRRNVKGGTAAVAFQDLLFWAISAGAVFSFVYRINNGQLRWYIFAGIALGAALYLMTVSAFIVKALEKAMQFIGAAAKFLWKIAVFPFRILKKPLCILAIPLSKFRRLLTRLWRKAAYDAKKMKKVMKMY